MHFETVLLLLFIASWLTQFMFWNFVFPLISKTSKPNDLSKDSLVSVLVVFKNESENLKKLIPLLIQQDYPSFEVLLINDFSEDNFHSVVQPYLKLNNCRIIHASKDVPGKKFALREGVQEAFGEFILVTDADCVPTSNKWIKLMSSKINSNTDCVLGFSPYNSDSGWLNSFIRFEACLTAIQYFSFINIGYPYMGVGRNLLFRKTSYLDYNPKHTANLLSGDDDLFVNEVAHKMNVASCLNPGAFTYSEPKTTFWNYIQQKRRHISTSIYYKPIQKLLLSLFSASQCGFLVLTLILLFSSWWCFALLLFGFMLLLKYWRLRQLFRLLKSTDLSSKIFFLDITLSAYYIFMFPFLFFPPKSWN